MGKKYKNLIELTTGFKYNSDRPIDDRFVVETKSDLDTIKKYEGLKVFVTEESRSYEYDGQNWNKTMSDDIVLILDCGNSSDNQSLRY